MKTLIKKELRENLPLALIGLLLFLLLLAHGYHQSRTMLDYLLLNISAQPSSLQPLLSNLLLKEAVLFCGLFGAVLGWMQTRNEAHRDLWAYLVHRPVTRHDIFLGKTIAGLVLYGVSAGLPLAGLVVVVWLPGHVAAPFEWPMALPLLEIFLAGLAGYFAGVLTGLRLARWYASRGLGVGWGIAAFGGIFTCPQYYQSLTLIGFAVGVLGLAVWGAYQTDGFYRGQPAIGKLALTAVMTAGCALALLVAGGLVSLILSHPFRPQYASYQMLRDGTVCKISHNGEHDEIKDLAGHPLLDPKTGQEMKYKKAQLQFAYGPGVDRRFQGEPVNPLNTGSFFNLWNITDHTLWYLDRHGKLVGFDGRTCKQVATLEARGADGGATDPFVTRGTSEYYFYRSGDVPRKFIPAAKTIYRVDFKERTLQAVLTLTNEEVAGYEGQQNNYGQDESQSFLFATRNSVYYLDHEGRVVFKVPYDPGFEKYPDVSLSRLDEHADFHGVTNCYALWFRPDYELNSKSGWKMPIRVQWIGPDGEPTQSRDLPAIRYDTPEDWTDKLGEALMPPIASVVETGKRWYYEGGIHYPDWGWKGMPLAVVCALLGGMQIRRYRFPLAATAGWTGFIFFFGLVGLLVLFCVQEWPARETCGNCQKLRVVDRETCEHCGAPFPPAEKNGTEIFAALEKATVPVEP